MDYEYGNDFMLQFGKGCLNVNRSGVGASGE